MNFKIGDIIYKKDPNGYAIKKNTYTIKNIREEMGGNFYDDIYRKYIATFDNGEEYIIAVKYISMEMYLEYAVVA